jgi:sulfate transport system permease protein
MRFMKKNNIKHCEGRLPGFGLSLGFTLLYLSLIVLIPLSAAFTQAAGLGFTGWMDEISNTRVLAALKLSFLTAFIAASVNVLGGSIVAWVLVRYPFPGRKVIDAMIDLPFALPTAVAGIALTTLYAKNGILGAPLQRLGIDVAFTPLGIIMALIFVGLPFVVRTVQPVMENIESELEEAAATLGASRFQIIRHIIIPVLIPSLLTGFTLAFARGIGEYGSVVFISGNMPFRTEIAPLLIVTKLEQYDTMGATAIAVSMLCISFLMLFLINALQYWSSVRSGQSK